jgi:hypothetical protein
MREGLGNIENETSSVAIARLDQVAVDIAFEIGKVFHRGTEAYLQVGQMLLAEKEQHAHGEWLRWLLDNEAVLGFKPRAAQLLMDAASKYAVDCVFDLWGNKRRISQGGKGKADPKDNVSSVTNDDRLDAEHKAQFLANATAALQAAHYDGPADDDIVAAARWVADAWAKLAHDLEARCSRTTEARSITLRGNGVDAADSADACKAVYAAGGDLEVSDLQEVA